MILYGKLGRVIPCYAENASASLIGAVKLKNDNRLKKRAGFQFRGKERISQTDTKLPEIVRTCHDLHFLKNIHSR